jgi:uncharacterized protein YciI
MPYVLVMLTGGRNAADDEQYAAAHRQFIDSLIQRNVVLLGGSFGEPVNDASAAYILNCGSLEEARQIAAEDPLVAHDVLRPHCVEWEFVAINPAAIDAAAIVRPSDI